MRRKTNLYQRLWYVRRNRKRVKAYVAIVFIVITLILFLSFIENRLRASMAQISEYKVKSIITRVVGNAVSENFPDNIEYNDIATISKDESGNITSVQTDIAKLNRIFANVSLSVQDQLSGLDGEKISIPLGTILGEPIFAAWGPDINFKVIPTGSVETDFKSEFTSAGINQTKHRIYLLVKTEIGVGIPFMEKKTVVTTSLPVTETVIVGRVPDYYIDLGSSD
ncbi:sporulation protein YunB [Acetivibrio cellulolyticus]|uniref:sporulation protein YunB n=1 Tax=Acetivibrio cellulolyticus TaxID=35830 RepID=UPI0001E2E2F6|nr:sporulation protein YunB [Acetivibrio cellulolyticus]